MMPYSAIATIDYTSAYQSRPGLQTTANGAAFTHSWLVPSNDEEMCNVNFRHQHFEPGHVERQENSLCVSKGSTGFWLASLPIVACEL